MLEPVAGMLSVPIPADGLGLPLARLRVVEGAGELRLKGTEAALGADPEDQRGQPAADRDERRPARRDGARVGGSVVVVVDPRIVLILELVVGVEVTVVTLVVGVEVGVVTLVVVPVVLVLMPVVVVVLLVVIVVVLVLVVVVVVLVLVVVVAARQLSYCRWSTSMPALVLLSLIAEMPAGLMTP
jgi:hypothetical protein